MSAVLSLLKEFPSFFTFHTKSRPEAFRFSQLEDGLPKGAVVEVSGQAGGGKTEVVLRFLAENPGARVAWVEEELTIYPCAFPQSSVGLERVLFVESPAGQALWSVHQILRSQVFGIVVLRVRELDEMALRRLQLVAEKTQTTVILIAEEPARRGAWPIAVQLQAHRSLEERAILLEVLKYRGQKSSQLQKSWQIRVSA